MRYLLPLRWMYEFCVEEGIDDIERLELEQIKKLETIVARKVANVKNSMQIVDNSRKILFMSGKEIHWHANVWYMERFNFAPERVNPSNPVQRLSFYEVTNERNRELLQEYMKYQVGIGDLALGNIRNQLCYIKKFLVYFNTLESICEITEEQIAEYFKLLQEEEIKAETVNRQIFDIHRFFVYLNAKGHIKRIIFDPNYYIQKVFPYHHDRSVQEDEYMEILHILCIRVTTKKSTGFRCFSFAQKEKTHGNQNQQRNTQLQGDCLLRPDSAAAHLFAAGRGYGGGAVLRPAGRIRPRDAGLAVHRGRCAYGGGRLLSLQRPDAGAIPVGVVQDQFSAGRPAVVAQRELPIRPLGEGG